MSLQPTPADPDRMALPEEIERAIEALIYEARSWYSYPAADDVQQARQALTTAILSRLTEAEAGREEAEKERDRLRGAILDYRSAAITHVSMEGPHYRGVSNVMFRHAWEGDWQDNGVVTYPSCPALNETTEGAEG